ncbi:hypothetical protein MTsPCn5_22110 [Croceitalea sp. MTPC5]|nr:hypothetical protein MTsPCn5_22110 [Croceitalea sp. MTPC5]
MNLYEVGIYMNCNSLPSLTFFTILNNQKIMVMKKFSFIVFAVIGSQLFAQEGMVVPFDSDRWSFKGDAFTLHKEEGSSIMEFTGGDVTAYLKDADFTDGVITYEIKIREERTFLGCAFRMQDLENYESFYVRPHQSGNPDATQYTPVYNDLSAWQLYHGEGYASVVNYQFNEWIPVKIIISGSRAEVYFNDSLEPGLHMPYLQRKVKSGMIGLWGGSGKLKNFAYTKKPNVSLKSEPIPVENPHSAVITDWSVYTDLFSEEHTEDLLNRANGNKWLAMKSDAFGRLNLAKKLRLSENQNTALVKYTLDSESDTFKKLSFGFSDRVMIYVNGKRIYSGNNTFRSRDYRFLGSIGYFDSVFLPLKKGGNEIIFAVSESFGGWGLMAKLD